MDGPNVFTSWPLDGWRHPVPLTKPLKDGFERVYLNPESESYLYGHLRNVLYRISYSETGEIIDIGETGQNISDRQNGRFREIKWQEIARHHELSIEVLEKKTGNINRKEAEVAHLTNYKNEHGFLPTMNRRKEETKTSTYTKENWKSGIRELARSADKENKFLGIRNLTPGKQESPNKIWKKFGKKFRKTLELISEVQILFKSSVGIVGLTEDQMIFYSKKILPPRNYQVLERIHYSSMFITSSGEIGYWDYEDQSPELFNDFLFETFSSKQTDFVKRLIELALRTRWE